MSKPRDFIKSPVKREYFNKSAKFSKSKQHNFELPLSPNMNFSFTSDQNNASAPGPFFKFDNCFHSKINKKKFTLPFEKSATLPSQKPPTSDPKSPSYQSSTRSGNNIVISELSQADSLKMNFPQFHQQAPSTKTPTRDFHKPKQPLRPKIKSINRIRSQRRNKKKPKRPTMGHLEPSKTQDSRRSMNLKRGSRVKTKDVPNKTSICLPQLSPNKSTRSTSCYSDRLYSTLDKLKTVSNISSVSPNQREFINFGSLRSSPPIGVKRRSKETNLEKIGNDLRTSEDLALENYFKQEKRANQSKGKQPRRFVKKMGKSSNQKDRKSRKKPQNMLPAQENWDILNPYHQKSPNFNGNLNAHSPQTHRSRNKNRKQKRKNKTNANANRRSKPKSKSRKLKQKHFFAPNEPEFGNKSLHFPKSKDQQFAPVVKRSLELEKYNKPFYGSKTNKKTPDSQQTIDFEIIHKGKARKLRILDVYDFETDLELFARKNSLNAEKVSKIRNKIREAVRAAVRR